MRARSVSTSICQDKLLTRQAGAVTTISAVTRTPRPLAAEPRTTTGPSPLGSRVPRSRGGSARCPAGASSSTPARCSSRCASSAWRATEFGPDGFLRGRPAPRPTQLASYGLQAVGGFLPVLLHDPAHDPLPEVDRFIDGCLAHRRRRRRARRLHRCRRLRRPPRASTRTAGRRCSATSTGSPTTPPRAASSRRSTRTSAPWSRPARRPSGSSSGSHVGLCIDTGHLARRWRRPGRDHRRPSPSGSCTCTSRTSTARWPPGSGRASRPSATPCGTGCSGRSARATSTSPAMVRTLEAAGYDGLVRPRAGRRCWTARPTRAGARADVRACLDYLDPDRRMTDTGRRRTSRSSRWAGSGSTSTPSRSASASRTSRRSRKFLGGSADQRRGRRGPARPAARRSITRTGDDPFGGYIHRALRGFGVDDRFVTAVPDLPHPGHVLRDLPARRLPALLLPPTRPRPTCRSAPTSSTSTRSPRPTSSG